MTKISSLLKPADFWEYFESVSSIPRGSGNEGAVRDYIISVAKKNGLSYKVDEKGNLVVSKGPARGYEHAPTIVLQGHMDMVCEKNEGASHDFTKDPIKLKISGDYLEADGTSLGADNGIGLASALTIMGKTTLPHPPLEFLFTVEEETGLTGAKELKSDFLKGKILLNLDSEEEGHFYIGCAGGLDGEVEIKLSREPVASNSKSFIFRAFGMKGGHSGLDIDKGRANALKVITRFLWNLSKEINFQLGNLSGGSKRNAIAREAKALIWIPEDKVSFVQKKVEEWEGLLKKEFGKTEGDLSLKLIEPSGDIPAKALTSDSLNLVLDVLYSLPHGVVERNRDNPDFVETSTNLAIIETSEDKALITLNHRSSSNTAILAVAESIEALSRATGVKYTRGPGYPGWQPDMDSPVLKKSLEVYKKLFGIDGQIKAIHAGLECGIIGEKFPGMDMISFGPTMHSVHSPDEKFYIPSLERYWKLLMGLLEDFKG